MSETSDLRPLGPEEAAAVARHPLPDGVEDAEMNKGQLALALHVSETTVDKWKARGLPVEAEGTNGRSYSFRLSLCWAWLCERRAAEARARDHADAAAAQMRLALVGEDTAAGDRADLSPKEQRDLLDLEYSYMRAAQARRELLRAEDVADGLETVFAAIRDGLDSLPDRLARELSLDGAGVEAAQAICDDVLAEAVRQIREIVGNAGNRGQ